MHGRSRCGTTFYLGLSIDSRTHFRFLDVRYHSKTPCRESARRSICRVTTNRRDKMRCDYGSCARCIYRSTWEALPRKHPLLARTTMVSCTLVPDCSIELPSRLLIAVATIDTIRRLPSKLGYILVYRDEYLVQGLQHSSVNLDSGVCCTFEAEVTGDITPLNLIRL